MKKKKNVTCINLLTRLLCWKSFICKLEACNTLRQHRVQGFGVFQASGGKRKTNAERGQSTYSWGYILNFRVRWLLRGAVISVFRQQSPESQDNFVKSLLIIGQIRENWFPLTFHGRIRVLVTRRKLFAAGGNIKINHKRGPSFLTNVKICCDILAWMLSNYFNTSKTILNYLLKKTRLKNAFDWVAC